MHEDNQEQKTELPEQQTDGKPSYEQPGDQVVYPLATRMQRLAAALLDDLIALMILLPMFGYYDIMGYWAREQEPPIGIIVNMNIIAFVAFILIHGYLLYNYGQTVGKRAMQIAICTLDQKVPAFNRLIALRYLPFRVLGVIPGLNVLVLVNILFIFRDDRRCLHDLLAGTKVIYVGANTGQRP